MKNYTLVSVLILSLTIFSCGSTKNLGEKQLYEGNWELDYISGPRIAFEGLFPDKKPQIEFDKATNRVSGNSGCNGYSADYKLNGKAISFGEPGPSTMMFCGGGEGTFLKLMHKVETYSVDSENRLNLMVGEVPLLRFKNIN